MSTAQAVALPDASKSLLSLVLSLSPLYFLVSARTSLGLDRLHVGLLQVLLLILVRAGLDRIPAKVKQAATRRRSSSPPPVIIVEKSAPSEPVTTPTTANALKKRQREGGVKRIKASKTPRTRPAAVPTLPPPPYPAEKLDETVANFLSITAPDFLPYVSLKPTTTIPPAPLAAWTTTYSAADISVIQHPTLKSLFGICATYPDVPLKALYEVLTDVEKRAGWDSMTQSAEEIERFEVASGRRANCMRMCMKGMAMVKAKDLVLLSVPGTLPTAASSPAHAVSDKLRIFAATTSVTHPRFPPTSEYNRMELAVSGFMIEEENEGRGSRIVQITDLSGLGSWIPGAVIRTITQTLLPKSLIKLGAAAALAAAEPSPNVEFPPPVLGQEKPSSLASAGEKEAEDDETLVDPAEEGANATDSALDSEEEDDDSALSDSDDPSSTALAPASQSRDFHALLTQLRSLTTRLAALETLVASPASSAASSARSSAKSPSSPSSSSSGPPSRPWYSPWSASPGTDTATLNEGKLSALFTLGSAAGAGIAVAALAAWGRRGQR
ncbi:hypothetical protein JCM8097_003731 [Rhodosporidiobolus ruineniae]